MKTINTWLEEYGESHKNPTNKIVHWICVPIIFWTITALFWSIKLPVEVQPGLPLNGAMIAAVLIFGYYLTLSFTLSIGLLLFTSACLFISYTVEANFTLLPLWAVAVIAFVLAWIGQFWGHGVEGKKPSFLKDIQFLMIGPAWLMSFIYQKLGIKY